MALNLILKEPAAEGKPETERGLELKGDRILIGRQDGADICLPVKQVSRRHAELLLEGKTWYLRDLGSGNGTLLNGSRIQASDKIPLKRGDAIAIGKYRIEFRPNPGDLEKSLSEITDSDVLEVKMIKKILSAMDKDLAPSLEGLTPPIEGKKISLTEERSELVIGRDRDCDFQIDDPVVSRRHVKLARKWGAIVLIDLKSKNGVVVDGKKITEQAMHDGDKFSIGHIKLIYRNPQEINYEALGDKRPAPPPTPPQPVKVDREEVAPPQPVIPQPPATSQRPLQLKGLDLALIIIGGVVLVMGIAALLWILG